MAVILNQRDRDSEGGNNWTEEPKVNLAERPFGTFLFFLKRHMNKFLDVYTQDEKHHNVRKAFSQYQSILLFHYM